MNNCLLFLTWAVLYIVSEWGGVSQGNPPTVKVQCFMYVYKTNLFSGLCGGSVSGVPIVHTTITDSLYLMKEPSEIGYIPTVMLLHECPSTRHCICPTLMNDKGICWFFPVITHQTR